MSKKIALIGVILLIIFVGFIGALLFTSGELVYIENNTKSDKYSKGSILSFRTTSGGCVDSFHRNISTELDSNRSFTIININQNMVLDDSNYILSSPSLEKIGRKNYTVFINSIEKEDKPAKNCTSQTRYNMSLQLPFGEDEKFKLNIKHNRKNVGTIKNGKGWSAGSAKSSGSSQI